MTPRQREALETVASGDFAPSLEREEDGAWYARWRAVGGNGNEWIDEAVRKATMTPLSADAENQKHATLHDAWLLALRSRTGLVRWDDAECAAFSRQLEAWAAHGAMDSPAARAALAMRLDCRDGGFFLECNAPRGKCEYAALGRAVALFGPLRALRAASPETLRTGLTRAEAETFLRSAARRLRAAGYAVDGVETSAQITAEMDISPFAEAQRSQDGGKELKARLVVRVAGEPVSAEEVRFLLDQGSTLVFFRNRWIEVDRGILREALRALEKSEGARLTRMEALSFAMGIGSVGKIQMENARAHGWLRGLVGQLRSGGGNALEKRRMEGFAGTLRDYQERGVAWLRFMTENGFGALLADDMGLGKTIQTIAWLTATRTDAPALIVAPLSLISNWRHEFEKFAPSLRIYVHYGEKRHAASGFARAANGADAVLTSYTLLVKDYREIREVRWSAIVIDEAQTVKNPDTRASRALRALGAPRRIALTGTPVENSPTDVWSLEEFLNPGFLPDRKTFADRFAKPLADDPQNGAAKRLRHALEPFILRRLKSDARIAAELGEKREIREYCELAHADRADYEAALDEYRASERTRGDVFALLTRLKLACDGEGKFQRLCDLLETIFANGESALVFTQYAKVGQRLKEKLEDRFKTRFPFMHGALSPQRREQETAAFNSPGTSAFILSLRTGGFGLNLVKATHVIHFDRWWNPAVEAQATDRAHRIGQTSTVFVHIFIASGTIEERVDSILVRKLAAAGSLVASGESFLAQLPQNDFDELVGLAQH